MEIRSLDVESHKAINTIVSGFIADPILRWMYAEPHAYLENFPTIVQLFGGSAFITGSAYCTQDYLGTALWLKPGNHPDEEGLVKKLEADFEGEKLDNLFAMFEEMDAFHPNEPCWHLAFIAVDPTNQNQGIGSALMEHTLAVVDDEGKVAYLESTNEANLSLYQRHGFELMGTIKGDESHTMYPMIREPH